MDDSKAQTLVGVQRSGLLLLDETGRCHGEISQMVGVRPSFCALLACLVSKLEIVSKL